MKQLTSHYGWLIAITLVIVVMMSFATPLGLYLAGGYINITKGAGNTAEYAVGNGYEIMVEEYESELTTTKYKEAGMYQQEGSNIILTRWDDLLTQKIMLENPKFTHVATVKEDESGFNHLFTNYDTSTGTNKSNPYISGELVLSQSVSHIDEYGLAGLEGITQITLKNTQIIEKYAFQDCKNLRILTIEGKSLGIVEKDAFKGCSSLAIIEFTGTYEEFTKISFKLQSLPQKLKVICSDKTVNIKF